MNKKGLILLVITILLLTGCTKIDNNMENVLSSVMSKEVNKVNTVSTGYQLYIPMGVMQLDDNEYNQKLKIRDTYVYLYVDTVSYYYKNSLNYAGDDKYNYFYREILLNDKNGYIGINKLDDDNFFVKIVYNYAKIEFYSSKSDLSFITANSLIILNSIEYNDNLIKMALSDENNAGKEMTYEFVTPDGTESSFYDDLQQYVIEEEEPEEIVLPDEE